MEEAHKGASAVHEREDAHTLPTLCQRRVVGLTEQRVKITGRKPTELEVYLQAVPNGRVVWPPHCAAGTSPKANAVPEPISPALAQPLPTHRNAGMGELPTALDLCCG